MSRSYWPLTLVLAALWGASYLFIKVGIEGGLSPGVMMFVRSLLAAAVLAGYLVARLGAGAATTQVLASWRAAIVLGALNAAIPFWLIAWGEKHIDSGVAAIAQSTVPIFTLLIGLPFLPHERIKPTQVAGVCTGFLGVGVMAGVATGGDGLAIAGTMAIVLASASYASASIYGQLRLKGASGPVLATGSMLAGGLILLPFAAVEPPTETPTAGAIVSLLLLALLGTAAAQLILFRVLVLFGARRFSLVTYLIPVFALVYGALILDESITADALAGLALILLGVALGSGTLRLRKPARATAP
jgi:drug/metabolite transporter (DMT)-like permease